MTDSGVDPELLSVWQSARLWVDLPRTGGIEIVPERQTDATHFPGGTGAVHFISAWNPGGQELEQGVNELRHRELLDVLLRADVEHWAAAGYAADHGWLEYGVALPHAGGDLAIELATRFGQLAIYEWTADKLAIVECTSRKVTTSYGWSSHRLSAPPEHGNPLKL